MAGFNTAVTGLKAAQIDLDVTGNNIANASTIGFKASRAEFGDIYATAVVGAGSANVAGSGVTITDIAQDFQAGTIEFTNNNLDLAINGSGFFTLADETGNRTYTRAGAFELDKDGAIVSKTGKHLQGERFDSQGNLLPVGNLEVVEKESSPHATEAISLSFNVDATSDAERLQQPYDKDNSNTFTYSTTLRVFDSLGDEDFVKVNYVEQQAIRQRFAYEYSDDMVLSGLTATPLTTAGGMFLAADAEGYRYLDTTDTDAQDLINALNNNDPRIDTSSIAIDTNTVPSTLSFEFKAKYSFQGDMVVEDSASADVELDADYLASQDGATEGSKGLWRPANHEHAYTLDTALFTGSNTTLPSDQTFILGGASITLSAGTSVDDAGRAIASAQNRIISENPNVQSVSYNDADNTISITWTALSGTNDPVSFSGDNLFTAADPTDPDDVTAYVGDNSYDGMYRMYAYLNDDKQLNLGKETDPGESTTATGTEVGSILLSFNPTTGLLREVNGSVLPIEGGNAPVIKVLGADKTKLDAALTEDDAIDFDLTGSTQFASSSIVKTSNQDGYPKGDLVGVTFSETGEMIASFSNGQNQTLGIVSIVTFDNQAGLAPTGNTEWVATLNSGDPIPNRPGTGLNGTLQSAALEQSNVDLSEELVALIEAQRNFQANSKTIETQNTITQNILQI